MSLKDSLIALVAGAAGTIIGVAVAHSWSAYDLEVMRQSMVTNPPVVTITVHDKEDRQRLLRAYFAGWSNQTISLPDERKP